MEKNCIFCKIIAKEIPSTIIEENDEIIVIKDINPKAPIHYLIIPKLHFSDLKSFNEAETHLGGKILLTSKYLSKKLNNADFRLVANNGKEVGQCVFHFHMHFLSGKQMPNF